MAAPVRSKSSAPPRATRSKPKTSSSKPAAKPASQGKPRQTQAAAARTAEARPGQTASPSRPAPAANSSPDAVRLSAEAQGASAGTSAVARGVERAAAAPSSNASQASTAALEGGLRGTYGELKQGKSAQESARDKAAEADKAYQADMAPRREEMAKGQKEIDDIVGIQDDKRRNLNITQKYSELSHQMNDMMGPDAGANWSTWATWASKQAGATIRQEDAGGWGKTGAKIADGVTEGLNPLGAIPGPRGVLGRGSGKGAAEQTYDNVSKSIANGNKKVFEEIAPHFDRFINTFKDDLAPNDRKWAEFSQGFSKEQGGLRDAFHNYYDAKFTDTSTDAGKKRKAELMVMGNDRIGLHEQNRLQPEIEGGMPWGARRMITNTMMGLKLPSENLNLGADLPPRYLDGKSFPKNLQTIDNPEFKDLLKTVDHSPNSLSGTGAGNWSNVSERMDYISDLFRSRHDIKSLFDPPFSGQQVQQLKAGAIPTGPL